ncbi:putative nucleoporin peptidase S59 [Arabidopsis thaliana]|uniref:Uncharacterized protein n=2 Tax=Arabidopsis TaxID=3701 RepID=A0A178WBM4_ARATH|nr:hypothetical protein ISN45_At01g053900 [Arabidopsis thaliana x Arabidopsis arenosa]OAP14773.1 hypothetical protein AXX17_AT1G56990 [Arabidopsis thaliana]
MKIDFSEPECSNCYQFSNPDLLNTPESEQSNVICSSITSVPVNDGPVPPLELDSAAVVSTSTSSPVQALGHDSGATVSTSTSSPVQIFSSPFSFGSAHAAITPVSSGPAPSPTFGEPRILLATSGSGASATSTSSTSSPLHSSSPFSFGSAPAAITSVSSGPAQSPASSPRLWFDRFATSSSASATSSSSTSSPFHSSSLLGFAPAVTSVSSAPTPACGPTQAFGQPTQDFGLSMFGSTPRFEITGFPFQASASRNSPSPSFGPAHNCGKPAFGSPFGNNVGFARPDVGISPVASSSTSTEIFGATPASLFSPFGPMQAPVQASASSTSTFPPFGCVPPSPSSGSSLFNSAFGSLPAPSSSNFFGQSSSNLLGQNPSTTGVGYLPGSPLNSSFPGFGVGYLPGSSSNLFRSNPPNFGGGSIGAGPQHFGFNGDASVLPSTPFSLSPAFSSNTNTGSYPFASHEWSRPTEQGSRNPGYAPTHEGDNSSGWSFPTSKGNIYISISASKPYLHKSHEELRWEDYKQGDKGGPFPAAPASTIGSRPNAAFSPPTVSPPAHGCTACGATSSSSASRHFTFNGATSPPSAATTPPGLFFPSTGFAPMMFGTNLAVQGTSPALQAYPVQGYILLPFAAMTLQ